MNPHARTEHAPIATENHRDAFLDPPRNTAKKAPTA